MRWHAVDPLHFVSLGYQHYHTHKNPFRLVFWFSLPVWGRVDHKSKTLPSYWNAFTTSAVWILEPTLLKKITVLLQFNNAMAFNGGGFSEGFSLGAKQWFHLQQVVFWTSAGDRLGIIFLAFWDGGETHFGFLMKTKFNLICTSRTNTWTEIQRSFKICMSLILQSSSSAKQSLPKVFILGKMCTKVHILARITYKNVFD